MAARVRPERVLEWSGIRTMDTNRVDNADLAGRLARNHARHASHRVERTVDLEALEEQPGDLNRMAPLLTNAIALNRWLQGR